MQTGGKLVATPEQEQVEVYVYENSMDDSSGDNDLEYEDFGFLVDQLTHLQNGLHLFGHIQAMLSSL